MVAKRRICSFFVAFCGVPVVVFSDSMFSTKTKYKNWLGIQKAETAVMFTQKSYFICYNEINTSVSYGG